MALTGDTVLSFALAGFVLKAKRGTLDLPIAVSGLWERQSESGVKEITVTPDDLQAIVRNFGRKTNGEVNVDFDFKSLMGSAIGGPIPSAGRVTKLSGPSPFWDKQGSQRQMVWGRFEPTDRTRRLLLAKEYRYSSSVMGAGPDLAQGLSLLSVTLNNTAVNLALPESQAMAGASLNSGGAMENQGSVVTQKSPAKKRWEQLVKTHMAETGKNEHWAEFAVASTAEGKSLHEQIRKETLNAG